MLDELPGVSQFLIGISFRLIISQQIDRTLDLPLNDSTKWLFESMNGKTRTNENWFSKKHLKQGY